MKYICSICGYTYDEEIEGIPFSELDDGYTCPLCGAPKALFDEVKEEVKKEVKVEYQEEENLEKLSVAQLAALFSNLKRGAEKQYQLKEAEAFKELADYFFSISLSSEGDLESLINEDLNDNYKDLENRARSVNDRGTLRIVTWGSKVTNIQKVLLERYKKEGVSFLKDNDVYVCSICGFIYVGKKAPDLCPVCKVPSYKFDKIERS